MGEATSETAGVKVLLVGSGGREHALARSIKASPQLGLLQVAPGNPGTAPDNVVLDVDDHAAVVAHCVDHGIDLVVVGPEAPLVDGLADALAVAGIKCFGPTARAARLEGSKAFTRDFAERHRIPGPRVASFTDADAAIAWLDDIGVPVVVKADGLAAGKGVIIPDDRTATEVAIRSMLDDGSLGDAGRRVLLEERLTGPELSLIGFCDGLVAKALPPAQDHKRVGAGDTGPNTGGMGAFAPVPGVSAEDIEHYSEQFLQTAVDGMAAEANPFVGMLYAGLMLTDDGPRLIEYNCRFGDPEAQVLLPLVGADILDVLLACTDQSLGEIDLDIRHASAATVVVAAEGYPGPVTKGIPIPSVPDVDAVHVIHAGTAIDQSGALLSSGGRVLNVVGIDGELSSALDRAYAVVDSITVAEPRLFARPDIGWRHVPERRVAEGTVPSAAQPTGVQV
jgi:phosphoribosylamine--glycine ligase